MRIPYHFLMQFYSALLCSMWMVCAPVWSQRIQFPESPSGLRPIQPGQLPNVSTPAMVPINPATQAGIYPSTGYGSPTFDPYAAAASPQMTQPPYGSSLTQSGGLVNPSLATPYPNQTPLGGYPAYNGINSGIPGGGQSATIGTFQNTGPGFSQPGVYPNSAPSALFPGSAAGGYPAGNYGGSTGSLFGNLYSNVFGDPNAGYGQPSNPVLPPTAGGLYPGMGNNGYANPNNWNPQGSILGANGAPEFLRLFQGPRFRQAYLHGNDDFDALMINDSDLSLGFAIPNFLFSTQPLYLLPSFSLHQWSGLRSPSTADLPAVAYSAFLDSGWQSDPAKILGAELALRVGMFSDFETATSDSLRIQGRGIGRIRLTPRLTLKGGVIYLDRNKVKLLPAGGFLWQPNQDTRFDLFFPEPKLAHYLATIGTADTWWYVGGYYGGGSWTVKRQSGLKESIDINDIRLVLGLEWGRSDQMRDGRRVGFLEAGYVFDRELLFKETPLDNLDLQDTFMVRAGIGY